MFDSEVSLNKILVSFEGVLKIEYAPDQRVQDTLDKAIQHLENTYGVTFTKDIYSLQSENQLTADNLNLLLQDIKACLEQCSFFIQLKLFHKNVPFTLADINYLGYAKSNLLTALRYLQDKAQAKAHKNEVIKPLYNTLDNISMCTPKRLFVVLLMLDRLGVVEGVALLAQLLYMGGLVQ